MAQVKKIVILCTVIMLVLLPLALVVSCVPSMTLTQFKAEAEPVIAEFLEAGAAKDVDRA